MIIYHYGLNTNEIGCGGGAPVHMYHLRLPAKEVVRIATVVAGLVHPTNTLLSASNNPLMFAGASFGIASSNSTVTSRDVHFIHIVQLQCFVRRPDYHTILRGQLFIFRYCILCRVCHSTVCRLVWIESRYVQT